jgi:AcrR family transcriptional regulator
MGRPAKFNDEQLFAAVAAIAAREGPRSLTTRRIADELDAPTGSLYHRYTSRDLLVAAAWMAAVRDFQVGFVAALQQTDLDRAAVDAARHTPRWAAAHPDAAALLVQHSRTELMDTWPDELAGELSTLNAPALAALRRHARLRFGSGRAAVVDVVRFALVTIPYGAVRNHEDPAALVDAVGDAALAALRSARWS